MFDLIKILLMDRLSCQFMAVLILVNFNVLSYKGIVIMSPSTTFLEFVFLLGLNGLKGKHNGKFQKNKLTKEADFLKKKNPKIT
jgi:hypothetical protein